MNALTEKALEIAVSQIGVRELKRNRGPEVDAYLLAVGLDPTKGDYPWCAAFCYWSFNQASLALKVKNPMPRTAGVMKLWMRTQPHHRGRPAPGAIMIIDHGGGRGHCGIVEHVAGTHVMTVEGNTDASGGREGDGVYRRVRRLEEPIGYIDYALKMSELVA